MYISHPRYNNAIHTQRETWKLSAYIALPAYEMKVYSKIILQKKKVEKQNMQEV